MKFVISIALGIIGVIGGVNSIVENVSDIRSECIKRKAEKIIEESEKEEEK